MKKYWGTFKGPHETVRDTKTYSYPVFELPGVNCICSQKDRQGVHPAITIPSIAKYQTLYNVPKCISYQKAIGGLVITKRAYFLSFCQNVCTTLVVLLWDVTTLCHETLLPSFIHKHGYVISAYMYT